MASQHHRGPALQQRTDLRWRQSQRGGLSVSASGLQHIARPLRRHLAGLKLLVGEEGKSLRQRLLLTLVRDNRLNTDDLRGLMDLMRRTFSPRRVAGRLLTRLNPLAA